MPPARAKPQISAMTSGGRGSDACGGAVVAVVAGGAAVVGDVAAGWLRTVVTDPVGATGPAVGPGDAPPAPGAGPPDTTDGPALGLGASCEPTAGAPPGAGGEAAAPAAPGGVATPGVVTPGTFVPPAPVAPASGAAQSPEPPLVVVGLPPAARTMSLPPSPRPHATASATSTTATKAAATLSPGAQSLGRRQRAAEVLSSCVVR